MAVALITIADVMTRLQVRRKAVMRLVRDGKLVAYQVGPQWRFEPRDIDAYLQSVKFTPRSADRCAPPPRRAPRRSGSQSVGSERYM